MLLLYLGLGALLISLILILIAGRQRRAAGLPAGRVIYSDMRGWDELVKPLYDPNLGLTGKPDYLIQQNSVIIPVEVKTGRAPQTPYDTHIFQLATYCMLVEKTYNKRPPYGIIHYPERDFAIDYTSDLEDSLLDLLADIRRSDRLREIARSHGDITRCRGCGFQAICDQKLT